MARLPLRVVQLSGENTFQKRAVMTLVALAQPVMTEAGMIAEIELREPTGADLCEIGWPYHLAQTPDGFGVLVMNAYRLAAYVDRLAAVPPADFRELSLPDAAALQHAVLLFFQQIDYAGPDMLGWSTLDEQRMRLMVRDDELRAIVAEAVAEDRARYRAIMMLPEANRRPALAEHLAHSNLTVDQVKAALAAAPLGVEAPSITH